MELRIVSQEAENVASRFSRPSLTLPSAKSPVAPSWQQSIRHAVRAPDELWRLLSLPASLLPAARRASELFPLFAPREYIARMRPGDPDDPLLRQVLPLGDELESADGFTADPVGDAAAACGPGLLRKYRTRALLITTGVCAIHCRYCFRRHYPYDELPRSLDEWEPALAEIAADATLDEVILSGGDPLMLTDGRLTELAERLAAIPHLTRLRMHTRLPIVIPARVCDALIGWLRGTRLAPIVVIHANHAAELDGEVAAALAKLADAGIVLLNQSVLLRGVNDEADALTDLSRRLVDLRVMPYYLHQLDRVAGAAHFEVSPDRGRKLIEELRTRLPGYAVPRYVQEVPGAESKTPM
ncbi:MAG: EF-P beta-lysylation protein EpmB [Planctomycetes bacterium]|nr:EF-P beta-lysylation protein EpmB [Planctomycetota bacterium]